MTAAIPARVSHARNATRAAIATALTVAAVALWLDHSINHATTLGGAK